MNDRTAHIDLLAQVADHEAEEREVRRILGAKLTEDDLDAHARWKRAATWPNCCGSCHQGRRACPTPQACQISVEPDRPRPRRRAGDMVLVIALLLACWATIALALLASGVLP